jgi:hypothetical protein
VGCKVQALLSTSPSLRAATECPESSKLDLLLDDKHFKNELVTETKTRQVWNIVFKALKDINYNVALCTQGKFGILSEAYRSTDDIMTRPMNQHEYCRVKTP